MADYQYRPIHSGLKSRHRAYREPENPVRSAYMKRLQEHDDTRRIYGINPYFQVFRLRENLYGLYSDSLSGVADQWVYLLVGPEKALVVDTGYGVGDLKGLIREIIGQKPLIVVVTHGHPDHAQGNAQFDRVYCHKYEVEAIRAMEGPHMWDELFDEEGNCRYTEFEPDDRIPFRDYELVGVENGHVFHLGGDYDVELIFMPGHSPGHCVLLDKKGRILFGGDDMCIGLLHIGIIESDSPYSAYATVTAFRNELAKLCCRLTEFDSIYPGHGIVDIGSSWLLDILDTCDEILADPTNSDIQIPVLAGTTPRHGKRIHDSGYLTYTLEKV